MSKILVVGGLGYIGREVCTQLRAMGLDYSILDSNLYGRELPSDERLFRADIRDYTQTQDLIDRFDTIIWLAAIVGEPACELIPTIATDTNQNALKVFRALSCKRVVFTSTASVYGIAHGAIDEKHLLNPLGIYAESKAGAEVILRATDNNVAIARLGTAFGTRPYTRPRFDLAINAMARSAVTEQVIDVYGADRKRPFIHIEDIAKALIALALYNGYCGTLNISHYNRSLISLAALVALESGAVIKCHEVISGDLRDYELDTEKAATVQVLDRQRRVTIKDGIHEAMQWSKSHTEPEVLTNRDAVKALVETNTI